MSSEEAKPDSERKWLELAEAKIVELEEFIAEYRKMTRGLDFLTQKDGKSDSPPIKMRIANGKLDLVAEFNLFTFSLSIKN
jgi:hypothetical protein